MAIASSEAGVAPVVDGRHATRLAGRPLTLLRVGWGLLALVLIAAFIILLPGQYTQLSTVCAGERCALVQPNPATAHTLATLGLSVSAYAMVTMSALLLLALVSYTVAGAIVWRRSDDWMAMLIALALIAAGSALVYYAGESRPTGPRLLAFVAAELADGIEVTTGLLFPTGLFLYGWMRLVPIVWFASGVALTASYPSVGLPAFTAQSTLALVGFAILAWALLANYRRLDNPLQRAQVRWVAFGGIVVTIIEVALYAPALLIPALGHPGSLYWLVGAPLSALALIVFSICVGVAILRYHLYDIDIIINRTLVYGSLTALLALVYILAVTLLQSTATALTGQRRPQPVAVVVSTLLIAALFQPLRRRLQTSIDRRFFRRKYDTARTLESFSARLRSEMDLADLSAQLVAVVRETMQPTHVGLWLRPLEPEAPAEYAQPSSAGRDERERA